MINVVHAFTGVDAQYMAEKKVWGKDNINVVGSMEIDVDAIISCALIHENEKFHKHMEKEWNNEDYANAREWLRKRNIGFDFDKGKSKLDRMKKEKLKQLYVASVCIKNFGDISLANKVKLKNKVDIFTYSSPCQSFSIAGKQAGLSGTSGLLLECEKFIELNKPKFLLLENVKNLVGKKFIKDFENWLKLLDKLGYSSYYKVLNAKDYGIPQNRERVFCLSIRNDIDKGYKFKVGNIENKCIQDILEDKVDNKYYLNQEIVDRFIIRPIGNNVIGTTAPNKTIGQRDMVYKPSGIMGALTATDYKQPKQIIVPLSDTNNKCLVSDKIELYPMISTNNDCLQKFAIRKLTPRECWRLMDFDDKYFDRVKDYISDTQLYKLAGNSIVVACLEHIFKELKNQYSL